MKHKKKIDESERVLHEHKRVRTVAQLKILEPIGTGLLADIPECPACLLPMLPPVKIFSCEREGSPHLRDVQAAGGSKHLRSLQESRPRGSGGPVRALAVENLKNDNVGLNKLTVAQAQSIRMKALTSDNYHSKSIL